MLCIPGTWIGPEPLQGVTPVRNRLMRFRLYRHASDMLRLVKVHPEVPMLRLTFLLCAGMFAALMIAGTDRGQLRPGLAKAALEAETAPEDVVEAEVPVLVAAPEAPAEPRRRPTPAPAEVAAATPPVETPPTPEPAREVVQAVEEPVFTLSALGTELVPGEDGAEIARTEAGASAGEGTIWFVNASSVNVRAEPSTEAEILGKLGTGEAALLVATVNDEWARIVIQGDGVEGFVALRYLSPEEP
jgi:hypothetical protein